MSSVETALRLRPAARELAAVAGRYAEKADANRRLVAEVLDGIVAAGFARHFVPARWGGAAGGFGELLDAVAVLGKGCTSAAWCAAVVAGSTRLGAYLPERGQAELWQDGPDVAVAAGLIPSGVARTVPGGWRLTGEWAYATGAGSARWTLVCAPASEAGSQELVPRFFAVPRTDYGIVDTWHALGMRATASNTLTLTDVFVPAHRTVPRERMYRGSPVGSSARCHTVPLRAVSGLLFAAPALGAARGALGTWSALAGSVGGPGLSAEDRLALARSAGEVDAAALLLARSAGIADAPAPAGGTAATDQPGDADIFDRIDRSRQVALARNPRDCALAVDWLVAAMDRLFRRSGTRVQTQSDPIQRAWRDVTCIASHVALRFEPAALAYTEQLLAGDVEVGL